MKISNPQRISIKLVSCQIIGGLELKPNAIKQRFKNTVGSEKTWQISLYILTPVLSGSKMQKGYFFIFKSSSTIWFCSSLFPAPLLSSIYMVCFFYPLIVLQMIFIGRSPKTTFFCLLVYFTCSREARSAKAPIDILYIYY